MSVLTAYVVPQRVHWAQDNHNNAHGPVHERCLFGSDIDFDDAELITSLCNGGWLKCPSKMEVASIYHNEG